MIATPPSARSIGSFLTLVILLTLLVISFWQLIITTPFGGNDFIGYWSATYLLHTGQDPYSPDLMGELQRTLTGSTLDFTIMAWNPPFLFVFLLPLAWMPFTVAKFVWLIINMFTAITAMLMLTQLYMAKEKPGARLAFIVFAFGFPPVLAGFYMGQVTFLVFWSVVASMWLINREKWFWAGTVLIFTVVKPHIAVLPVIYLLSYIAQRRQFQGWLGLAIAGFSCVILLLLFRQNLFSDLLGETTVARVSWATPTVGGILSYLQVTEAARYLILLLLPLPFYLILSPRRFTLEFSVALLTLVTVPTTFFGWSYDQTILLIPIAQVFSWLVCSRYRILIVACIVSALVINYYQRLISINEVYYVWIPIFWLFIFFLLWRSTTFIDGSHANPFM